MRAWLLTIVVGLYGVAPLAAQNDSVVLMESSGMLTRQLRGIRFSEPFTAAQRSKGVTLAVMLAAHADSLKLKELALTDLQKSAIKQFAKAQAATGLTLADTLTDTQQAQLTQLINHHKPATTRSTKARLQAVPDAEAYQKQCEDVHAAGTKLAEEARMLLTPKQQLASDKNWLPKYVLELSIADSQVAPLAKLFRQWWQRHECPGRVVKIAKAVAADQYKERAEIWKAARAEEIRERRDWLQDALELLLTPEQLKNFALPERGV